ncbi:hypothetical protein phytr_8320 [Candidatus Phycorickettsia trachydisci]|uniref:Uncharacterized protein n=1 Tax=Candidatus Phycorickettsia trachydisci TaxID=2115978 RepID=A0A2P1P925_9RICK|nr:ankyrin repeat domain-containing protein [Candidatus Phycorickettsia trachydisci]AVP87764.1 hypothetical protein phytr_8320 [Candidatus Phycorickettsia trachydisci]
MSIHDYLIGQIDEQNIEGVKKAIQLGADLNDSSCHKNPISEAAKKNNIEILTLLKDAGGDVNLQYGPNKVFPLYQACSRGANVGAKWLVDNGANVDLKTDDGATAMYVAASKGNVDLIEFLRCNGDNSIDLGVKNYGLDYTPIQIAARNGHLKVLQWFEDQDINIQADSLVNPAARGNATNVLEWLILRGIDVGGGSALGEAALSRSLDVVKLLFHHGADVNGNHFNPLNELLNRQCTSDYKIISLLLSLGGDLDLSNNLRRSFLMEHIDEILESGSTRDEISGGLNILKTMNNLRNVPGVQEFMYGLAARLLVRINDFVEVPLSKTATNS